MPSTATPERHPTWYQCYAERSENPDLSPLATYLLRLMHIKRTNLCVSADVTTTAELLRLAEEVGDHICVLKTHADMIRGFSDRTIKGLTEISRRKNFLIFEDRKFMDIGSEWLIPLGRAYSTIHAIVIQTLSFHFAAMHG